MRPSKTLILAIAFASACVAVLLAGLVAGALQNWFGISDLKFLVIWSLPLALVAALAAAGLAGAARRWSLVIRYAVGVGLGLSLGLLWTLCAALFLGAWWGAMSLPALQCWMAGAAAGVTGGLVLGPGASARVRVGTILGLASLAVAAAASARPLAVQLSHDQTLSMVFLRWTPGEDGLSIESEGERTLDAPAVALLRTAGISGMVRLVRARSRHGHGPTATALILLREPLGDPVNLRQPDRSMVLYVQDDDGFRTYPVDAKMLDRGITLLPREYGVWYSVHLASGGVQSSPARIW